MERLELLSSTYPEPVQDLLNKAFGIEGIYRDRVPNWHEELEGKLCLRFYVLDDDAYMAYFDNNHLLGIAVDDRELIVETYYPYRLRRQVFNLKPTGEFSSTLFVDNQPTLEGTLDETEAHKRLLWHLREAANATGYERFNYLQLGKPYRFITPVLASSNPRVDT